MHAGLSSCSQFCGMRWAKYCSELALRGYHFTLVCVWRGCNVVFGMNMCMCIYFPCTWISCLCSFLGLVFCFGLCSQYSYIIILCIVLIWCGARLMTFERDVQSSFYVYRGRCRYEEWSFDMAAASVRYAPEDPTLPKPWRGLVDGRTGNLYFWNPETNITQYERPVVASGVSSEPSNNSLGSSAQKDPQCCGYNDDGRYRNDGSSKSASDPGADQVPQVFSLINRLRNWKFSFPIYINLLYFLGHMELHVISPALFRSNLRAIQFLCMWFNL